MNERIRELMMQSWNTYFNEEVNGSKFPIVQKFDAEKFAELIVRECIANCDDLNSMKYIANHFGIKVEGLES